MRKSIIALACAGLWLAAGSSSAAVTVTFTNPDNYSDVPRSSVDRERLLKDMQDFLVGLGKKLPANENLKLDIRDIDLAGREEPGGRRFGFNDVRIMRGRADWPAMDIRYTLEADGKVIDQGEDKIADMSYQTEFNRYDRSDPLRYEKRMIDDWFAKKFLKK